MQKTLKDLTWENHKKAERTTFIKRLLNKQMTPYQYYVYLSNQLAIYSLLEQYALKAGVLDGIEEIQRTAKMVKDIAELEQQNSCFVANPLYSAVDQYLEYLGTIKNDPDALLAHIYVRHMGDLSGGQIIKRYVPGPSEHYEFDGDVDTLKGDVRQKLHIGLANEANICFGMVQSIFDEMETHFANMEQTD